jgi:uncharacterized membrane protein
MRVTYKNEIARLRRAGAVCAAMVAVLAVFPALTMSHHHWLGFMFIGLQVVLLVGALSLLAKAKKLAAERQG